MKKNVARLLIVMLMACCLPVPAALGWSLKEHILMTQIAAQQLIADPSTPPAMKDWLRAASRDSKDMETTRQFFLHQRIGMFPRGVDGLGFWATMPDLDKGSGPQRQTIAPFGVGEAQLHFTDLELLNSDPANRTYRDDLSHKPKVSDIPRDLNDERWKHAGMLPFRVEDCYKKVVASIQEGRLSDKDGQYPRDEHAEKWAGYLAHYLEDNCQPHHATIDYMSRTYFGKSNLRSPNVHSNVEGTLGDDDRDDHMALREEFWTLFSKEIEDLQDPTVATDPWAATIEVALASYDALPLIGRAAMAGYGIGGTPENPTGHPSDALDAEKFFHFRGKVGDREMTLLEMKAHQMAWAVKRVERVWRQAWDEANKGK